MGNGDTGKGGHWEQPPTQDHPTILILRRKMGILGNGNIEKWGYWKMGTLGDGDSGKGGYREMGLLGTTSHSG